MKEYIAQYGTVINAAQELHANPNVSFYIVTWFFLADLTTRKRSTVIAPMA